MRERRRLGRKRALPGTQGRSRGKRHEEQLKTNGGKLSTNTNPDELVQASFEGDARRILELLEAGAGINGYGRYWNPLHAAIENEQIECIDLLIKKGADLESTPKAHPDFTPLAHAVDIAIDGTMQRGGRPGEEPTEAILLLLAAGADPSPGLAVAEKYRSEFVARVLQRAPKGKDCGTR